MPKHIGIVAVSAEGAALCYRTICAEGAAIFGRYTHPEISTHTHPLAEYMRHIEANRWQDVASMLLSSAEKLRQVGAELLICPDNTVHHSPLPWLHIAEEVGNVAKRRGFRRLLFPGTISDGDSALPILDSTRILARSALREAARESTPTGWRGTSQ